MENRFSQIDITNEKIHKIINAAFKVFCNNELEKASTNKIVKMAGISRGLLYYYFKDKQDLFDFLIYFSLKIATLDLAQKMDWEDNDFLNRMRRSMEIRLEITLKYPFMLDFLYRYAYKLNHDELRHQTNEIAPGLRDKFYTHNLDFSGLKEGINKEKMIQVIKWTLRGKLSEDRDRIRSGNSIEAVKGEFIEYLQFLRTLFYKEEK